MIQSAVYFIKPHHVEIREGTLAPLSQGEVLVNTICSAISPGTEMLIYQGMAPEMMTADSNIPALDGTLSYPLKYGYATVGEVVDTFPGLEKNWIGKLVFGFQPHQNCYKAFSNDLLVLPEDINPYDGVFLPNMETAINFVMDGEPIIGETVIVYGQGIVGLLTTSLLGLFPLENLISYDLYPLRRKYSLQLGALEVRSIENNVNSEESVNKADLVYELTGNPFVLNYAINSTRYDGRIVIGSWYGTKTASIDLGKHFHRSRINIISSQVSSIRPNLRGRWNKQRRFQLAWEMIRKIQPSKLITHRFPYLKAVDAYKLIHENPGDTIQVIFEYNK